MSVFLPGTTLTLYDDFTSNDGVALAQITDWNACEWQERADASSGSRGYAMVTMPFDSAAAPFAAFTNVLRINQPVVGGPDRVWEYRIIQLDDTLGKLITLRCATILDDFAEEQIRSVNGGVATKTVDIIAKPPSVVLTETVLPAIAAQGFTGWSLGTVTPMGKLSNTFRAQSPLAIMAWLEQATGYTCWANRASETTWTLNLSNQNESATPPVAMVGRNVLALDRTIVRDDNFVNRVEPDGSTADSETEPTNLGQSQWNGTASGGGTGSVVTLSDPDGLVNPIFYDDQLNGLEALTANVPTCLQSITNASAIAFDTTRRYVWWIEGTETLRGHDVESDTSVSLNLAQGGTVLAMGYDASHDRLVIAYSNLATVLLVNPATPAIAATLTTSSNPLALSVVPELAKAYVTPTAATPTQIIDLAAGTIATWTGGPSGGAILKYLYHTASNRLVVYSPGATAFAVWAAPNGAVVASTVSVGQQFVMAENAAQTTMGVTRTGSTLAWGTATISGTPSFSGLASMPAVAGISLSAVDLVSAGGRYYVVGNAGRYVVGWNGTAWTGTVGDLGSAQFYALERGPTTAETSNLFSYDSVGGIRRLALTVDCSPFEHWTVQATNQAAQTVTMPASGSGGPVRLRSGARIQFRANPSFDYLTRLTDPLSIATYGKTIDASPSTSIFGKTNYWRGGTFDEWRSDDTSRGLTSAAAATGIANRFRVSEAAPVFQRSVTLTATYTAGGASIAVSGLPANQKIQVGDVFAAGTGTGSSDLAIAAQRAVADGSGNATITILTTSLGGHLSGTTLFYTQPTIPFADGQQNAVVLINGTGPVTGLVPLPFVVADAVAWVALNIVVAGYSNASGQTVTLGARAPFATADNTLDTANLATVTAQAQLQQFRLSQRFDLGGGCNSPGVGRFTITPPSGLAGDYILYVVSCSVCLTATSVAAISPPRDIFDSEGPRALWQLANLRLVQGGSPSVQYRCTVRQDENPFLPGVTVTLIDPTRGIVARPKCVSVLYRGVGPDQAMQQPEIELSNVSTFATQSIAAIQTSLEAA